MRLFIALELSTEIREELVRIQKELASRAGEGLRFMPPENLHLTLKFIGDFEEELLEDAKGLIRDACSSVNSFELVLEGAGVFPPRGTLRICWAGLSCSSPVLSKLVLSLNEAFELFDVKAEDREFKPHITIARPGRGRVDADKIRSVLASASIHPHKQEVKSIALFSSSLNSSGSTYEVLERFEL